MINIVMLSINQLQTNIIDLFFVYLGIWDICMF